MYLFGPARLIASQISSTGTLLSPLVFGIAQDVMVDSKVDLKELWGPSRYPAAVADGKGSIDITCSAAKIYAQPFAAAFGGTISQGGANAVISDEPHVVPTTPYIVNLASPAVGTVAQPLVTAVISGVQVVYQIVAASPQAGVSCIWTSGSPSQLTFAAGDTGITILVTYYYSATPGSGDFTITVANPLFSSAPFFQMAISQQTNNPGNNQQSELLLVFNRVIAAGLKLDFKVDDWVIPNFNMKAFADGNNNIGTLYMVN